MRPYLLERQQAHGEEEGARDSRHASLERANGSAICARSAECAPIGGIVRPYLLERQQAHGEEEGARDSRHASLERANEIGLPGIW